MAFVPGVDYDVFISYAHVDNQEGWVDEFHRQLELTLSQRVGRMGVAEIWRDEALDGSQLFDRAIRTRIEGSAVFLALCSPGYFGSDYCAQELGGFRHDAGDALRVAERSRVVKALLYNIPHGDWPEELGGTTGFAFHDAEESDDFGDPLDPAEKKTFRPRMRDLRDAVYKILVAMAEERQTPKRADEPAAAGSSVYLAGVSDGLRLLRGRVASDLAEHGIEVAEQVPPPYEAEQHDESVLDAVRRSRLAVHLFDQFGGAPVEESQESTYPRRQLELGRKTDVPQLVWVPRKLDFEQVEDAAQRQFLEGLEDDPEGAGRHDFIRGLPTAITASIVDRLERIDSEPAPGKVTPAVLLDTHVKDQMIALQASQALLERDVQPYVNPEEDDPRSNMNILVERLRQVQALIIVFGHASERWVRTRLAEAIKLAIAESCPLKACGVYLAPPDAGKSGFELQLPLFPVHLLDNRDGFDPATLDPILRGLRAEA